MAHILELRKKRDLLARRIEKLNPEQIDLELRIYDMLVDIKDEFQKRREVMWEEVSWTCYKSKGGSLPANVELRFSSEREAREAYDKEFGHKPNAIVVLNYDDAKHRQAVEYKTGIFQNGIIINPEDPQRAYFRECIGLPFGHPVNSELFEEQYKLANEDLATLLDDKGIIFGTNTRLIDPQPDEKDEKRPLRIGLITDKPGTRHLGASSATLLMPGTVAYTLSEGEHDHDSKGYIRRFQKEKNTFSTHDGENIHLENMLKKLDYKL